MLARHFADKATREMDAFVEQRGLTPDDLADWAREHDRRPGASVSDGR